MKISEHTRTLAITVIASTAALYSLLSSNLDAKPLPHGGDGFYSKTRTSAPFAPHGRLLRANRPSRMPATPHPPDHPFSRTNPAFAATPITSPLPKIAIAGMRFQPALIHIKAGDTVTWTNHEPALHIISSPNYGLLASDRLGHGSVFTHTFKEAGTYTYYCTLHPGMMGIVIVN